jgi:hypothetical protein
MMLFSVLLKRVVFFACLIFISSSCSNKLVGFYIHDKRISYEVTADIHKDDYLELYKDKSFIFESLRMHYLGDDITSEFYSFWGGGKYRVTNKKIILYFDENFIADSTRKLKLNPRFIRSGYKMEKQIITGTQTLPISIHNDSVRIGDMIRIR